MTNSKTLSLGRAALGCLLGLLVLTPIGQTWAQSESEKKGAEWLDKYVAATGGAKAYAGVKSRVVEATMNVPAANISMKMVTYAAGDKFYSSVDSQVGKMERGYDGKICWMITAVTGPKIVTGEERVSIIRDAAQDRFGQWRKNYSRVEYVGQEDVNGKSCAKLKLTPKPIDPTVKEDAVEIAIDSKTNHIVKYSTSVATPQGRVQTSVMLSNYKKVWPLTIAHTMTIEAQGMTLSAEASRMELNAKIPDSRFDVPEAVKKLQKK